MDEEKARVVASRAFLLGGESYCQENLRKPGWVVVIVTKAGTFYSEDGEMFVKRGF